MHWAERWNYCFLSWRLEEDPLWEVKPVEVEVGWMVEEAAEDWGEVEEVAYSWSCLPRSDSRNLDPDDY